MFGNIYQNKKVLVTGHTGFKGSWLVYWLKSLGATVTGVALPPDTQPSHWDLLSPDIESFFIDIRDEDKIDRALKKIQPDIIFHLAAQPLVRKSYLNPLETWATNVVGTANLLEAARNIDRLQAVVVITTDKCYENREWVWGYRENDPLGGHDPYSASKAGTELVVSSYRKSFFSGSGSALLASARAGNVIGGGDWSRDRLIPDLVRSMISNSPLEIRSPNSTRPWQHVLECLSGYLLLGQKLLEGDRTFSEAWNFGPDQTGNKEVIQLLEAMKMNWPEIKWETHKTDSYHEAQLLHLDSSKSRNRLEWSPVWSFDEAVRATALWYEAWLDKQNIMTADQINDYCNRAHEKRLSWAR